MKQYFSLLLLLGTFFLSHTGCNPECRSLVSHDAPILQLEMNLKLFLEDLTNKLHAGNTVDFERYFRETISPLLEEKNKEQVPLRRTYKTAGLDYFMLTLPYIQGHRCERASMALKMTDWVNSVLLSSTLERSSNKMSLINALWIFSQHVSKIGIEAICWENQLEADDNHN